MRALLTWSLLVLVGCATTASDPSNDHALVPSDRLLNLPPVLRDPNFAVVLVMRDAQFKGSAMTTTLTLDGEDVAHVKSGEKVEFSLRPGEHLLGLRFLGNDPILGMFTFGLARPKRFIESATNFEANRVYRFRIVDNANWEWELKRSSQ